MFVIPFNLRNSSKGPEPRRIDCWPSVSNSAHTAKGHQATAEVRCGVFVTLQESSRKTISRHKKTSREEVISRWIETPRSPWPRGREAFCTKTQAKARERRVRQKAVESAAADRRRVCWRLLSSSHYPDSESGETPRTEKKRGRRAQEDFIRAGCSTG
mgnify:CR=1 FL=1